MKNIKQSESWKLGNEAITRWSLEMPEMSGKCKSNPTKTNNLIYILKITQKMRKRTQKKRKPINKLRIYNFFWKSETDPKKEETDPKKRGNRSTNWEFKTFSEKRKLTLKKEETDPKKQETNQI